MLSKNQIKEIQSLQLKKQRDRQKLFIAEGVKTVAEVLSAKPSIIKQVYATREFADRNETLLRNAATNTVIVDEETLQKISLQSTPNQVLAVCHYFPENLSGTDLGNYFSFYLDDIRDPGNLGTIIRLADWFGLPFVFCSAACCDVYNPKVIQSTMGAFLRVRVIYVSLPEAIEISKAPYVYGALLNGSDLYSESLKYGLVVIGNEANGINEHNMQYINRTLTIPATKNTGAESLNAAMAASIIASEFFRQLNRQ